MNLLPDNNPPAAFFDYQTEVVKKQRDKAKRRHDKKMFSLQAAEADKSRKIQKYSSTTSRMATNIDATRTGMNLFNFLKPALIFMLVVILVLGIGGSALTNLLKAVGYWWIAFIVLALFFVKYRNYR